MTFPLQLGSTGNTVTDLTARLAQWQSDSGLLQDGNTTKLAVTSVFNEETQDVVKAFQTARNLAVNGVVNREVWQALEEAGYRFGSRLLWLTLKPFRGDDVLHLQTRLNQLGFNVGKEDGIYSTQLDNAVKAFQMQQGLHADGLVGEVTATQLEAACIGHQPQSALAIHREQQGFKHLARGGLSGLTIVLDPASNTIEGVDRDTVSGLTWDIVHTLQSRLSIAGAKTHITRGPLSDPSNESRAKTANNAGGDLLVSVALSGSDDPLMTGANAYYYQSATTAGSKYVSKVGYTFASALLQGVQDLEHQAGLFGRAHTTAGKSWTLLRATRMVAVVIEPGYITHAPSVERMSSLTWRIDFADMICGVLRSTIADMLGDD